MSEGRPSVLQQIFSAVGSAVSEFASRLNALAEDAYRKGYEDGAAAMRASILAAAQAPLTTPAPPGVSYYLSRPIKDDVAEETPGEPRKRAPKGAVGLLVTSELERSPGLSQQALKNRLVGAREISSGAIGNELRRQENIKYRRDALGRWFLIGSTTESGEASIEAPPTQEVLHAAA